MSGRGRGGTDPIWWLENEDHYLSTLKHKVNIYQHNLQDNPTVTPQSVKNLFKNLVENDPVKVHQCIFNEEPAMMEQHVFGIDSSEEEDDYTYEVEDYSNDDDDHNHLDCVNTFCGLRRNFLYDTPELSSRLKNITDPYNIKGSNSYRDSAEEAERIGQELVNEEEQAKKKAEKRRLKKKRQKERRRQQKLEKENRSENKIGETVNDKKVMSKKESCSDGEEDADEVSGNIKRILAPSPEKGAAVGKKQSSDKANSINEHSVKVTAAKDSKMKRDREGEDENTTDKSMYESEDEWDMNSSFVSKAANQIKRKMHIKPKSERKENEKKKGERKPEQTADSNALNEKILELAVQGNCMANKGRYEDAVGFFTEAIKYDPKEYRLFGNRSYCYERLQQYSRALSDAQIALSLNPSWPKGYFRKARALAGVKKYIGAIEAFQEVLRIDSSCKDAEWELLQVQMQLLMERGFTQQECEESLTKYGSLEQVLSSSAQKPRNSHINTSICVSDEDDKDFVRVKKSKNKPAPVLVQAQLQQPRELFPIWIGNVTTRVTEEALRTLFETVGTIHSIRMLQDRFCAFINFTTKQGAERAIAELQGTELEGTKLVIRHPDNNYKNLGAAKLAAPAFKPSFV
ncbi:tetratricopeptide repeat protein 31-like isoform X1 [Heterodontus francisci]|uniref:tetratricopeptide repeat protein 31-like isoform X1 n=1 Tax=Heterodontus francisci TaxID=7792 RepID=UPI00355B8B04